MIDPARLIDKIKVPIRIIVLVLVIRVDQAVRIIELLVLVVEHTITEDEHVANFEWAKSHDSVTVNLGLNYFETV
tara:strand:- start:141266 stop:141490 length:225 start_codon:yes stop_codon:yes gene_type:complete